ncbi:hypothetical protein N7532_011952 [Penicillium argentinense]|uniref:Uncharacterized protein n=1 Tax=Penicillium argentinense TaxID=1131581 RepID=A0A9W9EJF0_9EURO|nr:uncharacterized protein N7532_011952 [Penicillium argentinense]KAJ5082909.1 hypothetical protein N7532_011952 [Penicillium argentinense]
MAKQGSALIAKAIEIEEALGFDPIHSDRLAETRRLQYVSVCRQGPEVYSLVVARKKPASVSTEPSGLTLIEERAGLAPNGMTRYPGI